MRILATDRFDAFIASLAGKWEVLMPVMLPDGTRVISSPGDGPVSLIGGAVSGKPTVPFFPQQETVFTAIDGAFRKLQAPERPLFILGLTPQDLACLRFIDRFFAAEPPDDIYFRRRHNAVVGVLSGYCGTGGCLVAPAGGACDLEFFLDGERWLVKAYSKCGEDIITGLPESVPGDAAEVFRVAALAPTDENELLIRLASKLIRDNGIPDSFWEEIGDRCIACSGCNLVCPTCTCFGVQDLRSATTVERSRMWDSCQLDGFMREASGHNPLGSEALRTRRRIHHKLAADPEKWGEISCFLCGRCDAVCPTGIGIVSVAGELVARFG